MQNVKDQEFRVEAWIVRPQLNQIVRNGTTRQLEPKVMRVLAYLSRHPGQVVSKDELIDVVWNATAVTDNALARSVAALRKALEDDWREPRYVETVSKSGYRLIANVRPLALDEAPREGRRGTVLVAALGLAVLALVAGLWDRRSPERTIAPIHPTPVTSLPGRELSPAISPDGTRVAFMWRQDPNDEWSIYLTLIGTESLLRLTEGPGSESAPAWSPDGRFVAFVAKRPFVLSTLCGIYKVPAIGGTPVHLGACPGDVRGNLDWSPDGRRLAFVAGSAAGKPRRIHLLDVETGETSSPIEIDEASRGDSSPAFSPDGRSIAFVRILPDGRSDIYVAAIDGDRELRRVTAENRRVSGVDWTADGRRLVFSSDRGGRKGLWQVAVTGGESVHIPVVDQQMYWPKVAARYPPGKPRTDRMIYTGFVDDTNVWALDLPTPDGAPGAPEKVLASTREDTHPSISPDGRRLAFVSDRSGHYELWSAAPDGDRLLKHTSLTGPYVSNPRWAPDSRSLVFDARSGGGAELFVVDADSQRPRRLSADGAIEVNGSWSHDGRAIYFGSDRSGEWQIWTRPTNGGKPVQVTPHGGFNPLPHSGGRFLFYTKHDQPGIWRLNLQSGEEELLVEEVGIQDWANWTVTHEGLYFVERQPHQAIGFYHFATRQKTALVAPPGRIPYLAPGFSLTSDGGRLFWTRIDMSHSDVMLVEFGD